MDLYEKIGEIEAPCLSESANLHEEDKSFEEEEEEDEFRGRGLTD